MVKTNDKIWFKTSKHFVEAEVTFSARIDCLNTGAIPFDQTIEIREQLKRQIFVQLYGHMPRTCKTIMRHLKLVEQELRSKGETTLANRLSSSRALVDSLRDQMEVPDLSFVPNSPQDNEESEKSEINQ